ncbi:hypothetical protein BpHYR1_028288 [Brachionus plicatilis]|uniref:Uncharacterized protein n=1 Tax=Brachionus plicatilis TaxID=10195 RepID=A0A3M7R9F3_BRAPC|nr:hypothetical protein BpHYR1_028288 [Brachionus plicatilis]
MFSIMLHHKLRHVFGSCTKVHLAHAIILLTLSHALIALDDFRKYNMLHQLSKSANDVQNLIVCKIRRVKQRANENERFEKVIKSHSLKFSSFINEISLTHLIEDFVFKTKIWSSARQHFAYFATSFNSSHLNFMKIKIEKLCYFYLLDVSSVYCLSAPCSLN